MKKLLEWGIKHWKWGIPLLAVPLFVLFRGIGWVGRLIGRVSPSPPPASPVQFDHKKAEAERDKIEEAHKAGVEKVRSEAEELRKRANDKFGGGS